MEKHDKKAELPPKPPVVAQPWDLGRPLSEAIREFSDSATWAEYKQAEQPSAAEALRPPWQDDERFHQTSALDETWQPLVQAWNPLLADDGQIGVSGHRDAVRRARIERRERLRLLMEQQLAARLRGGDLVASGFFAPIRPNAKRTVIQQQLWEVLQLDVQRSSASAPGIEIWGILVLPRREFEEAVAGAPSRPAALHLGEGELGRRIEKGTLKPTLRAEAEALERAPARAASAELGAASGDPYRCPECGGLFQAQRRDQKYCGKKCRQAASRERQRSTPGRRSDA